MFDKSKVVSKTSFLLKDALTRGYHKKLKLLLLDEKKQLKGNVELSQVTARRHYTFFDLVFRNQLNIVPILGIDFSMANLTMNDMSFCLHTLKPGAPNDYITAINGLHQAFKPFSNF